MSVSSPIRLIREVLFGPMQVLFAGVSRRGVLAGRQITLQGLTKQLWHMSRMYSPALRLIHAAEGMRDLWECEMQPVCV